MNTPRTHGTPVVPLSLCFSCQYKLNLDIIQDLNIPPYERQHNKNTLTVKENIFNGDAPYSTDVRLGLYIQFMTLTGYTF